MRSFNWYWYAITGRNKVLEEKYVTLFIDMQKLIYAKANNKYMEDYDKNKESSYLQYWNVENVEKAMLKKLPVNKFWVDQRYFSI